MSMSPQRRGGPGGRARIDRDEPELRLVRIGENSWAYVLDDEPEADDDLDPGNG